MDRSGLGGSWHSNRWTSWGSGVQAPSPRAPNGEGLTLQAARLSLAKGGAHSSNQSGVCVYVCVWRWRGLNSHLEHASHTEHAWGRTGKSGRRGVGWFVQRKGIPAVREGGEGGRVVLVTTVTAAPYTRWNETPVFDVILPVRA